MPHFYISSLRSLDRQVADILDYSQDASGAEHFLVRWKGSLRAVFYGFRSFSVNTQDRISRVIGAFWTAVKRGRGERREEEGDTKGAEEGEGAEARHAVSNCDRF